MSAEPTATVPALRLRKGHVIPDYGPNATVSRPPIVSPDGSMISAVLTLPDDPTPRLLRVPVDQPITVTTNDTTGRPFVRLTRTAKSSGSRIALLDLTHPDSEIEPVDGQTYATLCTVHHTLRFYTSVSTADAMCSHPEEWCGSCARTARELAHLRIYGVPERKLA